MKKLPLLVLAGLLTAFVLAGYQAAQYERPKKEALKESSFSWPPGKRAALSLTFDDARPSQIDTGLPLLEKYGVKATFYVSPPDVKLRLDGWKRAVVAGHEIGNHTLTHPCTGNYPGFRDRALEDLTLGQMAGEIDGASRAIFRQLGVWPRTFAYPCGQTFIGRGRHVASFVPLVAERFLAGRKWLSEDSNDPEFCDLSQLLSSESDGKSFAEIKTLVDRAVAEGRWLVLSGHEVGSGGFQTTLASALEDLCRYAGDPKTGVWIDTVAGVSDYILRARRSRKYSEPGELRRENLPSGSRARSLEERAEELLGRMTLEEKVGQMNMP